MKLKIPDYYTYQVSTLKEMIYTSREKYGDENLAFQEKINGKWENYTIKDFLDTAENLAVSLNDLGIKQNDKLALVSKNRYDWVVTYMACSISGIIIVPMDRDLKEQELFHILHLSEAKAVVCSDQYVDIIPYIKNDLPQLKHLICMDKIKKKKTLYSKDLYNKGADLKEKNKANCLNIKIEPTQINSMLFTSGTTGTSKVVPLTHKNIISNIIDTCRYVHFDENDKWLSVLPLHHVYECTCGFLIPLYKGASIAFVESLYKIADNAREVKPSVMLGVPALYESIAKKIKSSINSKSLGNFKLGIGRSICKISEKLLNKNIRKKIYSELHNNFGGNFRIFITGGAAANPEVSKFFNDFGFTFIQGAGMTEVSPIYCVNTDVYYKDASIGLPIKNIEIKILNPDESGVGEIAVKGDSVFEGYFNNPKENSKCFNGKWFKTGDLGYIDNEGFCYITGRQKNVIVTHGGKNIYPEEIEKWLNKSQFILETLVWSGKTSDEEKEGVHSIVVPDYEHLDAYCRSHNIPHNTEQVKKIISKEIKHYSSYLAVYKRVKQFTIREVEFPKTTTRKIKRYLVLSELLNETKV